MPEGGKSVVGIILYGPFELAPYAKKYMKILDNANIRYDLIGWRRDEKAFFGGEGVYMYEKKAPKRHACAVFKIASAMGYRRYVKKLIKKNKYDRLIILTTQTAVILADTLLFSYKNKFIFDYRDKSYEYIKPYSALVNALVKASRQTVISSAWFKNCLTDKKDYVLTHNFSKDALANRKSECRKSGEKITVGYVGALRQYDYHAWLIDIFKNDERFEFYTYGCGDDVEKLKDYAKNYKNIFICGPYLESEKYKITDTFDMMCYNYPYSYVNDGAVANKYYDALIMKKPMFVNPETAVGEFVVKNNLGVGINEKDKNAADKIYNWYQKLDEKEFSKTCDFYLDKYAEEDRHFYEVIKNEFES